MVSPSISVLYSGRDPEGRREKLAAVIGNLVPPPSDTLNTFTNKTKMKQNQRGKKHYNCSTPNPLITSEGRL